MLTRVNQKSKVPSSQMQYYLLLDSLLVPLALLLLLVLESLLLEVVLLVLTDQLVALLVFLNRKIVQISSLSLF